MTFARRPGPLGRFNRRGLGSLGGFRPTQLSGCALWLRGDLGVTTTAPATTADWTGWGPVLASFSGGTTITDNNDGAPAIHYGTYTPAGALVGKLGIFEVELKAGGLGARAGHWVRVQWGSVPTVGADFAYVNLATGAVGSKGGGVISATAVDMGGGWWKVTMLGTVTSAPMFVVFADTDSGVGAGGTGGNGDITYDGDGTASFQMRNFSADQKLVTAWANQGDPAHLVSVTQGTAANQPTLLWNGSIGGKQALDFDGADDYLRGTYGATLNQPTTSFVVVRTDTTATTQVIFDGLLAGDRHAHVFLNTTGVELYGGTALTSGASKYAAATPLIFEATFNGASSQIFVNGTSAVGPGAVGAQAPTGITIGNRYLLDAFWLNGQIAEIIEYSRDLPAGERARVRGYLGARYGIAVA